MITYMIIDHTDKDTFYFDNYVDVENYIEFWNHRITIYKRTLSSWEEIEYIDRIEV